MNSARRGKSKTRKTKNRSRLALALLLAASFPFATFAETERPQINRKSLIAPLYVDGKAIDSAWVFPATEAEPLLIETATLLKVLKDRMQPEAFARLQELVAGQSAVSASALSSERIQLRLREDTLEAVLEIDASLRPEGSVSIAADRLKGAYRVSNADWSGYVNALASESFHYGIGGERPRDFDGALFGAMRLKSWVLEGGVDYTDRWDYRWAPQDVRLIHENTDNKYRFELGDVQPSFVGFQTSPSIGGASLGRSQSVRSLRSMRPVRDQTLFVKRPSRIEIFINKVYHTTVYAAPGTLQLKDLPVMTGLTNVELVITDDLGQTERVSTAFLFDADILADGEEDFAFASGAPMNTVPGGRAYDRDKLFYSAFYRRGILHHSVFGLNFQAQEGRSLAGLEGTRIFAFGLLSGDVAMLTDDTGRSSGAARARYRSRSTNSDGFSFNYFATLTHRSGDRASVLTNDAGITYPTVAELGASRPIDLKSTFSLSLREEFPKTSDFAKRFSLFMDTDRELAPEWLGRLSFSAIQDRDYNYSVLASLIWTDGASRQASVSYERPTDTLQASASYFPAEPIGGTRANARVSSTREQKSSYAQVGHTANRFEIGADHQHNKYDDQSNGTFRVNAGTSFVWAGSHATLSRPQHGSFALVTAPDNLENAFLPINNRYSSAYSETTSLLPGVVPNLPDFLPSAVFVDQSTLPEGFSLSHYQYFVEPGYRTGALIELKGEGTAMAVTTLLDEKGEPLPLKSGEVISLDHPERSPVLFFTNTQGRTVVEGLVGGAYEFHFFQEELRPVRFEIPQNARGVLDLPPIRQ